MECIYVLAELLTKLASIREVVMGAPLKIIFKHLASRTVAPELDRLVAIMHRPNETFFLVPQVYIPIGLSYVVIEVEFL